MKKNSSTSSFHYVFIADNEGMNILFPKILDLLKSDQQSDNHISVLYFLDQDDYLFKDEVEILSNRFSDCLISYFNSKPQKEFLESIIVTNTKKHIKFELSINEEWQNFIIEHLKYLGINQENIQTYAFKLSKNDK